MNYMNLFEHYRHDVASIPLENNLTRIFARILKHNYYVADAFFRLVNKKMIEEYGFASIYDNVDEQIINVDIQKTIGKLKEDLSELDYGDRLSKIIGIALTAENIIFNKEKTEEATDQQRPDIFVSFNNYSFIFEAKKTKEDCSIQLKKYIKAIVEDGKHNTQSEYVEDNSFKLISISWDEIVTILEKTIECGYDDIIVREYLEYLNIHFPNLFDIRPLSKSLKEQGEINTELFNKRIDYAIKNIVKYFNKDSCFADNDMDGVLYLTNDKYQQRISFERIDNSEYIINTWIADTKSQLWYFIDSKRLVNKINNKYSIYIKLADTYGHGRYWIPCASDLNEVDISKLAHCYPFCGRDKGGLLLNRIKNICNLLNVPETKYYTDELNDIIKKNKLLSVSVGIKIENRLPINTLVNEDKDFNKNNEGSSDRLAKMLGEYVRENLIF